MTTRTVFLFDIDGTLLLAGGVGRRSFEAAFAQVCGNGDAFRDVSFGGMTDPAIARAGLAAIGRDADAETIATLIDVYLAIVEAEIARAPEFTVMPHARETAELLRARREFAVGIGTGNVKRGAILKLARAGLDDLFDFGGYGCDDEDRATLLRHGAERGAAHLGVPLGECRVVVVGDTRRDVLAARAIGAECIGVGTGGVSPAELVAAGATVAFDDLRDPAALSALLG